MVNQKHLFVTPGPGGCVVGIRGGDRVIFHSIEERRGWKMDGVEEGWPTTFNLIDAPDLSRGPIFDPAAKLEIHFWTNRPPSPQRSANVVRKVLFRRRMKSCGTIS